MKRVSHEFRELGLLINLLVLIGFVVLAVKAFTPGVQPSLAQADIVAAPTLVAATATALPTTAPATVAPTATALPPATATAVNNIAAPATVAATVAATTTNNAAPAADAVNPPVASDAVVAVVNKGTCNACHAIPGVAGAVGIVGPNLSGISGLRPAPAFLATRRSNISMNRLSILMPLSLRNAPLVPVPGAMPATLAQTLTPEEIQVMVDYLLTLQSPQ